MGRLFSTGAAHESCDIYRRLEMIPWRPLASRRLANRLATEDSNASNRKMGSVWPSSTLVWHSVFDEAPQYAGFSLLLAGRNIMPWFGPLFPSDHQTHRRRSSRVQRRCYVPPSLRILPFPNPGRINPTNWTGVRHVSTNIEASQTCFCARQRTTSAT